MDNPTMFVGSSTESLDVAYAVQANLDRDAECVVWNQNVFRPTAPYLDSLVQATDDYDFACFICGPDDVMKIGAVEAHAPRDNVIFELGLFIGAVGRDSCFVVHPRGGGAFHLPSDILGIKDSGLCRVEEEPRSLSRPSHPLHAKSHSRVRPARCRRPTGQP